MTPTKTTFTHTFRSMRSVAATATIAAVGVLGLAGTASASEQADAADNAETQSVQYYDTWTNIDSFRYASPDPDKQVMKPTGGVLYAGSNYFYCQQKFKDRYTDDAGNTNVWWAKTDDDSGNANVWVPATAFKVGGDDEAIPDLERC